MVNRRRLFWAGIVLGCALSMRIQLAPVIAVAVLGIGGTQWRAHYMPLLGGLLPPLLLLGLLDALTLGTPWQSIWLYAWVNQMDGVSAAFGRDPWDAYWPRLRDLLGFALPVLGVAAGLGARDRPLLFWTMLGGLVTLSAIPHKELRFLQPLTPLVLTLAGIGTAQALGFMMRWRLPWLAGLAGAAGWLGVSYDIATQDPMRAMWTQRTGMIRAMRAISADPAVCDLGFYPALYWAASPGYSGLRTGISLWFIDAPQTAPWDRFNRILADDSADFSRRGFSRGACWNDDDDRVITGFPLARVCLWQRTGGCAAGPAPTMHTPLPPELQALEPKPAILRR